MSEIITIPNIENYTQQVVGGALILVPKPVIKYISKPTLPNIDFNKSTINKCTIKTGSDTISSSRDYEQILIDIWQRHSAMTTIYNSAEYNFNIFPTGKRKWCSEIGMAFEPRSNTENMIEIAKLVDIYKYSIYISITLANGNNVNYKNY